MMVCQICMLRLLHDVGTIFTISSYKLGTMLGLIVTVNMEFYIIKIIARKFVFWHLLCRYSCVSSPFCWHYIFGFLSVSTYLLHLFASQICSPFTICCSFLVSNWKVGLEPGPTGGTWTHLGQPVAEVLLYLHVQISPVGCSVVGSILLHVLG